MSETVSLMSRTHSNKDSNQFHLICSTIQWFTIVLLSVKTKMFRFWAFLLNLKMLWTTSLPKQTEEKAWWSELTIRPDTSDLTHSQAVHNVLTNSFIRSLEAALTGFFTQRVVGHQNRPPREWSQHQALGHRWFLGDVGRARSWTQLS